LVVFTDCEDPERAKSLLSAFVPVTRTHLSLLCRISDPKLEILERQPVTTVREMYSKTAANLLGQERKDALSIISSAGVHVLDSEPQDLAKKLVNYYFSVKERSLL
jgi:uncharacterized protein (DUF58 family)